MKVIKIKDEKKKNVLTRIRDKKKIEDIFDKIYQRSTKKNIDHTNRLLERLKDETIKMHDNPEESSDEVKIYEWGTYIIMVLSIRLLKRFSNYKGRSFSVNPLKHYSLIPFLKRDFRKYRSSLGELMKISKSLNSCKIMYIDFPEESQKKEIPPKKTQEVIEREPQEDSNLNNPSIKKFKHLEPMNSAQSTPLFNDFNNFFPVSSDLEIEKDLTFNLFDDAIFDFLSPVINPDTLDACDGVLPHDFSEELSFNVDDHPHFQIGVPSSPRDKKRKAFESFLEFSFDVN
eukprot:TRINITY_DN5006_c0_g1_i1.p1 TRINITY_DN5006_c0_g1~~TRINITY_DN5006_c0_g1_i1.p1  ORF type:complete len:287 (-),score=82.48 TRINITY_DN5006_c0_g1_i1:140-1000(-)